MPPDPTWPQIAQRRARKVKVLSNYKFYLAFENSPIDDYVSEKVFEGLIAGTIPVYRGAKRIDKFMPSDKSFINANNLTPRELADLLIKLTKDENAYNTYFEWKSKPLPKEFHEIGEMSYCHPNVVRRICDYAFEQQKKI
jgi:alpha-1,3-fucosyltransferase 10